MTMKLGKEKNTQPIANAEELKAVKKRKRKKTVKTICKIVVLLVVLAVAAFYVYTHFFGGRNAGPAEITYTYAQVERRDITEELSGSGTLESADSYTLSTRVGGDILSDTFAEGDTVKEGDVLVILEAMKMENEIITSLISIKLIPLNLGFSFNTNSTYIT